MSLAPGEVNVTERENGVREIEWHERLGQRSRKPYLFFVKDGKAVPFKGDSIPKILVKKDYDFVKNGKWSSTYWTLLLAPGWEIYNGLQAFDGGRIFNEKYESWKDIADFYKADVDSIKEVFQYFSPREFNWITQTEEEIKNFYTEV